MKTLDNLSKRILVIAVSISLVLLSASAFILTIQRANAQVGQPQQTPVQIPLAIGLGISNGLIYYGQYTTDNNYMVKTIPLHTLAPGKTPLLTP